MPGERRISLRGLPIVQLALAACLVIWLTVLCRPIGWRGQWQWVATAQSLAPGPLIAGITALAAALIGAWSMQRRRLEIAWRALLVLGASVWPLLLYSSVPNAWATLTAATVTDVSCEYFGEAYRLTDPLAYCAGYAEHQRASGHHLATHPPGAVLTYWAIIEAARATGLDEAARPLVEGLAGARSRDMAEAFRHIPTARPIAAADIALPFIVAVVFSVLGALTVLPAAAAARAVWGPEGALPAGLLAATVPGLSMLFQCLDAPLALVVAVAVWLTIRACAIPLTPALSPASGERQEDGSGETEEDESAQRGNGLPLPAPRGEGTSGGHLHAALAGFVLGLGLFISFGVLAAVALCGLVALCGGWSRPAETRRARMRNALPPAAWLALGVAVVWVLLVVFLGQDPLAMAARSAESHRSVIAGFHRAYGIWVWMNLVEYGVFLGPALAALVVCGASAARARGGPAACLAMATLAALALLDLSGTVRAEVGRIWLFFAAPLAVIAAGACLPTVGHPRRLWLTVALQVVALLALVAAVHPSVRPF